MAIYKVKSKELPSDAVLLSPDEALIMQMKMISDHEPKSEVWALRYTPTIVGGMSALSGIYINSYWRAKLKLGSYGRLSSYLPIVVLPAAVSSLFHTIFVQRSIVLDSEACPVCTQLRAATFQAGLGVVYPSVLAPLAALMFATRHYTYRLPSLTEKPKEVLALGLKLGKPIIPFLGAALLGQSLITMYLTYKEMMLFYQFQLKLLELEESYENGA